MSIDRQLDLNLKGNKYIVEFPNVGKFQNIEALKQVLSKGMYSSLMSTGTVSSSEALDMIDMEAYLTVLAPKIVKDLKCSYFGELGLEDYLEIKGVYQEKFIPWWNGIMELLAPRKKEEV